MNRWLAKFFKSTAIVSAKGLLAVSIGILVASSSGFASSIATPASSAMENLGIAFEYYAKEHRGQIPANLGLLDSYLIDSVVERLGGGSMDEAVMLVNEANVGMVAPNKNEIFNGGTILAVTARPISEDRRSTIGRYVIWRSSEGQFRTSWLPEKIVSAQLANAGVELSSGDVLKQPRTMSGIPGFVSAIVIAIMVGTWFYLVKPGTRWKKGIRSSIF